MPGVEVQYQVGMTIAVADSIKTSVRRMGTFTALVLPQSQCPGSYRGCRDCLA